MKARPWLLPLLLGLVPTALLVAAYYSIGSFGAEKINPYERDLTVYFHSADWVSGKGVLYKSVFSEYPLPANLIFALVRIASTALTPLLSPLAAFETIWMVLCGLLYIYFVRKVIEMTASSTGLWAILTPAVSYFSLNRYDIFLAIATLFCLFEIRRERWLPATLWLSACIALKGYALFLVPAYFMFLWVKLSFQKALNHSVLALAPFLLFHLAILAWAGWDGLLMPYKFHLGRSFNGETSYDVLIFIFGDVGISDIVTRWHIPQLGQVATSLVAAFMMPKNFDELLDSWLFALFGFMLFSNFASPQWILWVIPLTAFSKRYGIHFWCAALSWATFIYFPLSQVYRAIPLAGIAFERLSIVTVMLLRLLMSLATLRLDEAKKVEFA